MAAAAAETGQPRRRVWQRDDDNVWVVREVLRPGEAESAAPDDKLWLVAEGTAPADAELVPKADTLPYNASHAAPHVDVADIDDLHEVCVCMCV